MPLVVGRQQSLDVQYWPGAGPLFYKVVKHNRVPKNLLYLKFKLKISLWVDTGILKCISMVSIIIQCIIITELTTQF